MTDEITPAMTDQEWRTFLLWRAGKMPGGYVPVYSTIENWSSDHKHAGAAQCLYGQPFGFTREDVELLRGSADCVSPDVNESPPRYYPPALRDVAAAGLREIADRIASLLPPEP